jgi:hypothetical protein
MRQSGQGHPLLIARWDASDDGDALAALFPIRQQSPGSFRGFGLTAGNLLPPWSHLVSSVLPRGTSVDGQTRGRDDRGGLMATIASEFFAGPREQRGRRRSYFPLLAAVVYAVEAVAILWLMELVA